MEPVCALNSYVNRTTTLTTMIAVVSAIKLTLLSQFKFSMALHTTWSGINSTAKASASLKTALRYLVKITHGILMRASANARFKSAKKTSIGLMKTALADVCQQIALKDKNSLMMTVNAIASNLKNRNVHATNILTIKLVNANVCPKNAVKTTILIQETANVIAKSR